MIYNNIKYNLIKYNTIYNVLHEIKGVKPRPAGNRLNPIIRINLK